jgi:hypothetical protein
MDYRIFIFSRNELKIILVGTVIGGIFQLICWKYLKNHPELLNNENSEKLEPKEIQPKEIQPKKPGLRRFFPRGGALVEVAGAKIVINVAATIVSIAKKGTLTATIITAGGVLIKKVPKTAISTVIRNAFPTQHADFEKGFILVDGKRISLDKCDRTFEYLFNVLTNKEIPFEYKKELSFKILMDHVDLQTTPGRLRFAFCIISILHIFAINDISSYFILIQNLIKAIKNGKISKRLARLIIRRLLRLKIAVDPELIQVAA